MTVPWTSTDLPSETRFHNLGRDLNQGPRWHIIPGIH
jgi:hypothetical protein